MGKKGEFIQRENEGERRAREREEKTLHRYTSNIGSTIEYTRI